MIRNRKIMHVLGYSAVCVFVGMAIVLKLVVEPHVGFLPQAELGAYSDSALLKFAQDLEASGRLWLYKGIVLFADTVFIVLFGLWVLVGNLLCSSASWRWIGLGLVPVFIALDFIENTMIINRIAEANSGDLDPATMHADVSLVHYVTLAKYAAFAFCLISTLIATRRQA